MADTPGTKEADKAEAQKAEVTDKALETVGAALAAAGCPPSNDDKKVEGQDATDAAAFGELPIESLICAPIIAATRGQRQFVDVYVDGIKELATTGKDGATNTIDMPLERPVIKPDGSMTSQKVTVKAPVLSLVPLPALLMDSISVDFNIEVKSGSLENTKKSGSANADVNYKSWFGLGASIKGTVTSDSAHRRSTDSSATYHIVARAVQQPPSEGMAKLTALLASAIEPIQTK